MTPQDRDRIMQMLDEAAPGESPETAAKRILREMPHVRLEELMQVLKVRAEMLYQDAAEQFEGAEGTRLLCQFLSEAGYVLGIEEPTLERVLPGIFERRAQGDQEAAELWKLFERAANLVGLGG